MHCQRTLAFGPSTRSTRLTTMRRPILVSRVIGPFHSTATRCDSTALFGYPLLLHDCEVHSKGVMHVCTATSKAEKSKFVMATTGP